MFDLFKKKKSGDVIDYTLLEKRGLLKEDVQGPESQPFTEQPLVSDLPVPTPSQPFQENPSEQQTTQNTDFFSAMASGAEPPPSYSSITPSIQPTEPSEQSYLEKERVDKIEDRVEHVLDRIYKILQRIEIIERKIERLERRSGLGRIDTY